MKSSPSNNSEPVIICLLQTHGVVIALSEKNTLGERTITYAHQNYITHEHNMTSDDMLFKLYNTYKIALQKLATEVVTVPLRMHIFFDNTLSHGVYRHHRMHRKNSFIYSDKLIQDIEKKDRVAIQQKYQKKYIHTHHVVNSEIMNCMVNGYPVSTLNNTAQNIFSLEYTSMYSLIPESITKQLEYITSSIYHQEIDMVYQNLSGYVIKYLASQIQGHFLYVHIGETSTMLCYVVNSFIKDVIHVPLGTGVLVSGIMNNEKITLVNLQQIVKMIFDQRIQTAQLTTIEKQINDFWKLWRDHVTQELSKLVLRGATIPKIMYSYDNTILPIDKEIFPQEPYDVWYGSRNVVHIPCETILCHDETPVAHAYIKSLLTYIQKTITL